MHTKHSIQSRFTQEQLTPFGSDCAIIDPHERLPLPYRLGERPHVFVHFLHSNNLPDGDLSCPVLLFTGA